MTRMDRTCLPAVVAALVLAVLPVACGSDGDETTGTTRSPGGSDAPILPLLGRPGEAPTRPALVVKIDNTDRGRPQAGLAQADIVFEELVEGGLTRLLAVYHSQEPGTVGPVRSARSTDLSLLPELGRPVFAWSGANRTFAAAVERAELIDAGYTAVPGAYRRSDERPAPYDLYATPEDLWAVAPDRAQAPRPLFEYGTDLERLTGPRTRAASAFRTLPLGPIATTILWRWDRSSGVWTRTQDGTPHVSAGGTHVTAANVIVRTTPYRDSGVRDSRGAVVPEAVAVGRGEAWLLSRGRTVRGRWHKPSTAAPTAYTDRECQPFHLAPGRTWVEVLPPGAGEIT